jgi:hypothetical protein
MSLAACFSSPTTGPAYLRLPEYLDDYVTEDNPMRVIDVFADELEHFPIMLRRILRRRNNFGTRLA